MMIPPMPIIPMILLVMILGTACIVLALGIVYAGHRRSKSFMTDMLEHKEDMSVLLEDCEAVLDEMNHVSDCVYTNILGHREKLEAMVLGAPGPISKTLLPSISHGASEAEIEQIDSGAQTRTNRKIPKKQAIETSQSCSNKAVVMDTEALATRATPVLAARRTPPRRTSLRTAGSSATSASTAYGTTRSTSSEATLGDHHTASEDSAFGTSKETARFTNRDAARSAAGDAARDAAEDAAKATSLVTTEATARTDRAHRPRMSQRATRLSASETTPAGETDGKRRTSSIDTFEQAEFRAASRTPKAMTAEHDQATALRNTAKKHAQANIESTPAEATPASTKRKTASSKKQSRKALMEQAIVDLGSLVHGVALDARDNMHPSDESNLVSERKSDSHKFSDETSPIQTIESFNSGSPSKNTGAHSGKLGAYAKAASTESSRQFRAKISTDGQTELLSQHQKQEHSMVDTALDLVVPQEKLDFSEIFSVQSQRVMPLKGKHLGVLELAKQGLKEDEIARRLGIGKGEIKLILGVRR